MKLVLNENALRIAVLIFSFVFCLLSVALVALGVIYAEDLWWPQHYIRIEFLELSTLIVILGCLSFIVSIMGCVCAKSDNQRLFQVFIVCMSVLLALELSISVISFLNLNNDREEYTKYTMDSQLTNSEVTYKPTFYEIEEHYKCCGINSAMDYVDYPQYIPKFCCLNANKQCTIEVANSTKLRNMSGCASAVVTDIKRIAFEAGWYLTFISGLQIVKLFTVILLMGIKDDYKQMDY